MIELKYSTFWPRFCAGFVDGLIFMPLGWTCYFTMSHSDSIPLHVITYIVNASAFMVYSIWMHSRFGQTLGKMACKIIVLDISEKPLSMRQAVLRDILGVVLFPIGLVVDIPRIVHGVNILQPENFTALDSIINYSTTVWFAIEVITMLTNDKRRALHDFIAGSVVARIPNQSSEQTVAMPAN